MLLDLSVRCIGDQFIFVGYIKYVCMDVSVVIPTRCRPELLNRCLDALQEQEFPEGTFEVIIVTDGPDHETMRTVTDLKDRSAYRVYSLDSKRGPAAARNFGWRKALGKLILFTDDDCIPGPWWVRSYWLAY